MPIEFQNPGKERTWGGSCVAILSPVESTCFPLLMYRKEQELLGLTLLSFFFFLVLGIKPALIHAKYTLYPVMTLIWRNIYCWILFLAPTWQLSNCQYLQIPGNPMAFSSLSKHHTWTWCTDICRQCTYTHRIKNFKITIWIHQVNQTVQLSLGSSALWHSGNVFQLFPSLCWHKILWNRWLQRNPGPLEEQ